IEPYFSQVFEKVTDDWSINEKPTAKWLKFAGLYPLRNDEGKPHAASVGDVATLLKARTHLQNAHEQYSAIGVSTMIDNIDQRIRALESGDNL
ncbi:terminase, partial [Vibrio sp. 10N.222.54.F6]